MDDKNLVLERFGQILEESLNEIYIFDANTLRFLTVNRGARTNLGYTMEELSHLTPLDLKPQITPVMFTKLLEPLRSGVQEKVVFTTKHLRKDASMYPVEVHLHMSTPDPGSETFVAIILDITERINAEEALRVSDRLASLGTMIAGVAHEINTPLTTISGLSELIANDPALNTNTRQNAHEIVTQVSRTTKIIDDLLGLARVGRLSQCNVQFNKLIQQALGHLRNSQRFVGVEIVEDYDDDLPETYADPFRLEQVFVNIIRNAGDALRLVKRVRRLTICTKRAHDQIYALFTDTGNNTDSLNRVFDPFFTTKSVGDGVGLGLSVSLGIIRDHGGEITVEKVKAGTQFMVTLPLRSIPSN